MINSLTCGCSFAAPACVSIYVAYMCERFGFEIRQTINIARRSCRHVESHLFARRGRAKKSDLLAYSALRSTVVERRSLAGANFSLPRSRVISFAAIGAITNVTRTLFFKKPDP